MRYIILVLSMFTAISLWSQELTFSFKGTIENSDLGSRESGVTISAVQNGGTLFSTKSASNGKYSLKGNINYLTPFYIVFSKNGLVSKKIYFDLAKMNEEDIPAGNDFRPIEDLSLSMFKQRENVDFSFLDNEAVAEFDWNTRGMSLRLDQVKSNAIKAKILELLAKADKDKMEAELKYQAAIKEADKFYDEKNYENALAKYEEALGYKPAEKYPADRIIELDALIQAQKAAELADKQENEAYYKLIEEADKLRDEEDWVMAVSKYKEALTLKDEQYPKDQIVDLEDAIEKKKLEAENQKKYEDAIKKADAFLKQNSIRAAKDEYTKASKLKPSEQYPKDKLAEIDGMMKELEEAENKKKQYDEAIVAADELFNNEDYEGAKSKYQEALTFESSATYPKERVKMCDEKIAELQAAKDLQEKIAQLLADGNNEMTAEKWEDAKSKFTEVITLDDTNAEAIEKLAIVEAKIKEAGDLALQEEKFNQLVLDGDNAVGSESFEVALAKYNEAKAIKSTPELEQKIAGVNSALAALEEEAKKNAQYNELMSAGQALLDQGNLTEAKSKFEEALALDETQDLPKAKIEEINKLLAENALEEEKLANYKAAIEAGDHFFNEAKWEDAKAKYREAMSFDSSQTYPNERISEIEKLIEENDALEKQKADYNNAVGEADQLMAAEKWDEAIDKYNQAITIDGTQTYPSDQIAKIEEIKKDLEANQAKMEAYEAAIKAGDDLYAGEKYEDAISKYEEAIALDDSKSYPVEKINEIKDLIASNQAKEELKAKYDQAIEEADELMSASSYDEAKAKYNEAISIDGTQVYPKDKIAEIDALLAKNASEKEKQEAYNNAIIAADALFENEKWTESIAKYQEAIAYDSSQSYPQTQIEKANEKIALLQEEQAKREKEQRIAELLSEANTLLAKEEWNNSKAKFVEVLAIDSTNQEAKDGIDKINSALSALQNEADKEATFNRLKTEGFEHADKQEFDAAIQKLEEALTYKEDSEIRTRLEAINQLKSTDQQYADVLSKAEAKMNQRAYDEAISLFENALQIKPAESYPSEKIEEIRKLIEQEAEQAEIDRQYNELMKKGDDLMSQQKYLDAITEYNNALRVKPDEQEPVDKAAEAERLEKAKDEEIDAQYEKILTVAQKKIDEENFSKAVELLNRAMTINPKDKRPEKMLNTIENLKARNVEYAALMDEAEELKNAEKYKEAISRYEKAQRKKPTATEPVERIEEIKGLLSDLASASEKELVYRDFMSKGEVSFKAKSYELALTNYKGALNAKPGDAAAQDKINEINQILDDISKLEANQIETKNKFDAIISDADVMFAAETYLDAKSKYEEALSLIPSSSYAKTQIDECIKLERLKGISETAKEYEKIIKAGDKYFNLSSYDKAMEYYNRAISLKGNDPYPRKKLDEIDAILNPTMVESAELEDLGDPFDSAIMDGSFILAKAEEERKLIKKTKIQNKLNDISDSETEMTTRKTQDHYNNSNEIYLVQQRITADAGESDLNRKALIEALKRSQLELENADRDNVRYNHSESISSQELLYTINEETALTYGEKEGVYRENTSIMTAYNTAQAKEITGRVESDYDSNISSDQEISEVKSKISDGDKANFDKRALVAGEVVKVQKRLTEVDREITDANYQSNLSTDQEITDVKSKILDDNIDSYEKRAEVAEKVVKIQKQAGEVQSDLSSDRYDVLLNNKSEVNTVAIAAEEKAKIESELAHDNNDELKSVKNDAANLETSKYDQKEVHTYKVNDEISAVKRKVIDEQIGFDENRKETTELLKEENRQMAEAHYGEYNAELEKYVSNKILIDDEVKTNNEVDEKAKEAHGKKVKYVEHMDKKATIASTEAAEGDLEERLQVVNSIDKINIGVEEKASEEKSSADKKTEAFRDVNRTLKAQESANSAGQQEKHYKAQAKLNKVDDKPRAQSKVANSLGQEYPEGVTQESFTRSDNDGLVTTVITRRIVVIDGHADVYVRTQTLGGITYSKNGKPSLSHVWQKETQGAHLERHY